MCILTHYKRKNEDQVVSTISQCKVDFLDYYFNFWEANPHYFTDLQTKAAFQEWIFPF